MSIILPFGIWASKCIPSTLCAVVLFLTGPCGGRAPSNSARLQWPTNLASFSEKKKTHEKLKPRWGTDLPGVQKLDLPSTYISQMRKQTPVEPWVHTGVNVDLGRQVLSPGSRIQLLSTTQHCVFNCPLQISTSCLWVLLFLGKARVHKLAYGNLWGYLS